MEVIQYNGEELEVHTGDRGGKHIITSGGKKRYLTESQKSSIETKSSDKKIGKNTEKKSTKKEKNKKNENSSLEEKVEKLKINKEVSDDSSSEPEYDTKSAKDTDSDNSQQLYQENSPDKSRIQLKDLAKLYKKQIPENIGEECDDEIENMINSVAKFVRGKKDWIEKDEAVEYISNFLDTEYGKLYNDEISACFKSVQV